MIQQQHKHRFTYQVCRIPGPIETKRYTAEDGSVLVMESSHATLTSVGDWPVRRAGRYDVHRAVDAEDREGFVLKLAGMRGVLQVTAQGVDSGGSVMRCCPRDEWGADGFYLTQEDALVAAGDERARTQEHTRLEEMTVRATEAAAAIDGEGESAWSRAAYEAACAAAGVEPADDDRAQWLAAPGGVYSIPEYHREHVIWARLAYRRAEGITREVATAETDALSRAEQAAGTGSYTRAEYDTACAAAGIDALDDAAIPHVVTDHYRSPHAPLRDVVGEMETTALLGRTPETAATLAARRLRAITAELAERRARERRELADQGHDFATPSQIETIMGLLSARAASGEGGGFFDGPTDRGGVANLDQSAADRYITSLRGDY